MNQTFFNERIGENLRRIRNTARMTQGEVAQLTDMSRASIANMETGRQAMSAYQAMRIASALKLASVEELFDMRPLTDNDGDAKIYRAPVIEDRARTHLNGFMSRHGS